MILQHCIIEPAYFLIHSINAWVSLGLEDSSSVILERIGDLICLSVLMTAAVSDKSSLSGPGLVRHQNIKFCQFRLPGINHDVGVTHACLTSLLQVTRERLLDASTSLSTSSLRSSRSCSRKIPVACEQCTNENRRDIAANINSDKMLQLKQKRIS
jgi:hypothetical protein